MIILFILLKFSFNYVWILLGENWCWSLLHLKGLMILFEDDLPELLPIGKVHVSFKNQLPSKEINLSWTTGQGFFQALAIVTKYCESHKTVNTRNIYGMSYCVARNKPLRSEISKPPTATVISLWFWGFLVYPELYCDWPVHNQHSWNFSGVHSFLSLTVMKSVV